MIERPTNFRERLLKAATDVIIGPSFADELKKGNRLKALAWGIPETLTPPVMLFLTKENPSLAFTVTMFLYIQKAEIGRIYTNLTKLDNYAKNVLNVHEESDHEPIPPNPKTATPEEIRQYKQRVLNEATKTPNRS